MHCTAIGKTFLIHNRQTEQDKWEKELEKFLKGQKFIVDINAITSEGQAVAKIDDFVVFINGGAPKDKAEIILTKVSKNYAVGKIISLLNPSDLRVTPECPYFGICGGCQLQHISYDEQLKIKQNNVFEQIKRIGGIDCTDIIKNIVPSAPFYYRNKVQFVVEKQKLGLYSLNSHSFVNIKKCILQSDLSNKILESAEKILNTKTYAKLNFLRHFSIRTSSLDEVCITLVSSKKSPLLKKFASDLVKEFPEIKSVSININRENTNVIYGKESEIIFGDDSICEKIFDKSIRINCESFFQVNYNSACEMVKTVKSFLPEKSDSVFLDSYCGSGFFSLFASDMFKKTVGIEENKISISQALRNVKENNINNAEFVCSKMEDYVNSIDMSNVKYALVDPPRKGLDISVIELLTSNDIDHIVYVSCNPATLARDLKIFSEKGFTPVNVQPIDMFPQTAHVETVVKLERR